MSTALDTFRQARPSATRVPRRGAARVCSAVSAGAWGGGGGGGGGDSAGASAFLDGQGRSNGVGPLHLHSDHLLSAHAGSEPVAGVPGGTADGNDTHMPTSLFTTFPRLPPDGSTITPGGPAPFAFACMRHACRVLAPASPACPNRMVNLINQKPKID